MDVTSLVAWTLLHFVWQGTLVAVAAALALRALSSSSANSRYAASTMGLALMALLPLVTFTRLSAEPDPAISARVFDSEVVEKTAGPLTFKHAPSSNASSVLTSLSTGDKPERSGPPSPIVPTSAALAFPSLREWGNTAAPFVVRGWLGGVFVFSLRLLLGWLGVRRLVSVGVQESSETIRRRFEEMSTRVRVSRVVRLVESAIVRTPATVGFLRPVLLWPLSLQTGLTVSQIDLLLAHELAHLKRHDYLVNLLQTMMETALFYHPGVWWLSKRVRDEREACCDDIALSVTGDPRDYAQALLALEAWRQKLPLLATGAAGGNLTSRVRRLFALQTSHSESRPRWAAFPLAIAALAGILGSAPEAPARTVTPREKAEAWEMTSEKRAPMGPAQPSSVTRYEGAGSFPARIEWAMKEAAGKGLQQYWIGYAISADPSRHYVYVDRMAPVITSDGSMISGRLSFNRANSLRIPGVPLRELLGPRPTDETAIFLGFKAGPGGALERVHAGSAMLPIHFNGLPLLWLDEATDAESIGWIKKVFNRSASDQIRDDLVGLVASHTDAPLVFAALKSWIESEATEAVRSSAVEEMGSVPSREAVTLLDHTARTDRSKKVRREAADALGEQPEPEATKVLGLLARNAGDLEVAKQAAESLGERQAPEAFDELVALAWSDVPAEVRRQAVESMGESSSSRHARELEKLARTHPLEQIRREAIEALGESKDPEEAISILESVAKTDASRSVREEAVDTLAGFESRHSEDVLSALASSHPEADIRRKSIEALWEKGRRTEAMEAAGALAKSNDLRSARTAVEMLGEMESEETVSLLDRIARTDSRPEIEKAAIEALASASPVESSFKALREIAVKHPREEVQRKAVESLGEIEAAGVLVELDRIARTHPSEQIRVTAVEAMDLEKNSEVRGILQQLATNAPSERVQEAAIEALVSNGSTPEQAAWLAKRLEQEGSTGPRASRVVQMAILNSFEEMGSNGIEFVIAAARSQKDHEVQQRAIEILAESSDPRAKRELARILEK